MNEEEETEQRELMKEAVKEAIKEWLDEKFITIGKWTFNSVLAVLLAALVYLVLIYNGWEHKT